MTTEKEREVIQKQTFDIINAATGKDRHAQDYLWMLARITRTMDDIYDQDQPVSREELLEVFEYLFVRLPSNPFFNYHRSTLLSQHLSMYNAWMAANKRENGDETDQIYAHVWRDTHHEVVPIVALLTQGYRAMERVSELIRTTFKNKLGE
tara:strand:+ start:3099 stop:3551 length:453 start_codon:yes stop_codon:yes gene_type:complete